MSSSGTTAENECGLNQNDDKLSETEGSPEKTTMHSSGRDGIPSQVFPVPLQNIISKFVQQLDDTRVDDDNIQKSVYRGVGLIRTMEIAKKSSELARSSELAQPCPKK